MKLEDFWDDDEKISTAHVAVICRRLTSLFRSLILGGGNATRLAEMNGVKPPAMRHYLASIEASGTMLVKQKVGNAIHYKLDPRDPLYKLYECLTPTNVAWLLLALAQSPLARSIPEMEAAIKEIFEQLAKKMGPGGAAYIKGLASCIHLYDKGSFKEAPPTGTFFACMEATHQKRICKVTYKTPGQPIRTREILPLKVFTHGVAPYILHWSYERKKPAILHYHRIKKFEVTNETDVAPRNVDPNEYMNGAFGVWTGGKPTFYRLRFHPDVADYILERLWHPSQRFEKKKGGYLELTFTVGASPEVMAFICSWREFVQVMEPTEARDEMHDLWQKQKKVYPKRSTPRAETSASIQQRISGERLPLGKRD